MNSSDTPSRITKAFAVNGLRNTIPTDSSTTTENNGVATFDKGFPAITMQPLSAGGIPPSGEDVNGALYAVTHQQQWQNAGMGYTYNQTFASSIGGYPRGAIITSSSFSGQWLNLNEQNQTPPESPTGMSTGWVPVNNYGITEISGLTNISVTLSSLQAAKERIILTGTLTSNINIIFPSWIKTWVVHNNCSGNFTITCKTLTGSGVITIPGLISRIFCDSVNISDETNNSGNDMTGMVAAFAMQSPPTGWLVADGTLLSRNIYSRLFSVIGTLYGSGDGSTTFAIPDLRGEFIRGADLGRGVDPSRQLGKYQPGSLIGSKDDYTGDATISYMANGESVNYGNDKVTLSDYPSYQIFTCEVTNKASVAPQYVNNFFGVSRPRNISQMYCIKY